MILTVRPKKTGAAYDKIWVKETDESPLRKYTREQAEGLAQRFPDDSVVVDWAMRYGNPSIASKLEAMTAQGCQRILVMALYPQYCAATTATVYDKAFAALKTMRWQPAVRGASLGGAKPGSHRGPTCTPPGAPASAGGTHT